MALLQGFFMLAFYKMKTMYKNVLMHFILHSFLFIGVSIACYVHGTQWVVIQTTYAIDCACKINCECSKMENPYSEFLGIKWRCAYCGAFPKNVVIDYTANIACKNCAEKLFRFLIKNNCKVKEMKHYAEHHGCVNSDYIFQLFQLFPYIRYNFNAFCTVLEKLKIDFDKVKNDDNIEFYSQNMLTTKTFQSKEKEIANLVATCGDCHLEVEGKYLFQHAVLHMTVCKSCDFMPMISPINVTQRSYALEKHVLQNHVMQKSSIFSLCPHCSKSMLYDYMKMHTVTCRERNVACDQCEETMTFEVFLTHILTQCSECEDAIIHCNSCHFLLRRTDFPSHVNQWHEDAYIRCSICLSDCLSTRELLRHTLLKHSTVLQKILNPNDASVADDTFENLKEMCEKWKTINQQNDVLRVELLEKNSSYLTSIHRQNYEITEQLCSKFLTSCKFLNKTKEDMFHILSQMEASLKLTNDCVWRIEDVENLLKIVHTNKEYISIFSSKYYTRMGGYAFFVEVCFNGNSTDNKDYLSVYVFLDKGDYDGLLQWPFKGKVCVSLISQENNMDHIEKNFCSTSVICNNDCYHTQSVDTLKATLIAHFPKYALLSALSNEQQYVKNNTMFIRCIINED